MCSTGAGLALGPAGFSVTGGGGATACCAAQVAEFLGTIHHEFTFTVQEGLDALEDLVWHIESFEQVCVHPLRPRITRGSRLRRAGVTCYRSQARGAFLEPPNNMQLQGESAADSSSDCSGRDPCEWGRGQVRAAVPMYILTRKIKAMGIKVVLSGEGADEAFGGYLFFHKAPNPKEYHQ